MNYLQRVVEQALLKNPNVAHDAKAYAKSINDYSDLLNLDPINRSLVATELGATDEQMSGLLTIVKAVWNGGKCEEKVKVKGEDYESKTSTNKPKLAQINQN